MSDPSAEEFAKNLQVAFSTSSSAEQQQHASEAAKGYLSFAESKLLGFSPEVSSLQDLPLEGYMQEASEMLVPITLFRGYLRIIVRTVANVKRTCSGNHSEIGKELEETCSRTVKNLYSKPFCQ
jgi:hypothetical protein